MEQDNNWLKVPEVAKELRVPRSRAYELIAKGELPAVRSASAPSGCIAPSSRSSC